jgi:predicted RNA binding protein YcfA (HicA-like mRNA interferase family)
LEVIPRRGKGDHCLVRHPVTGKAVTIPHFKPGEEVDIEYIKQTLRKFNISRDEWLKTKK